MTDKLTPVRCGCGGEAIYGKWVRKVGTIAHAVGCKNCGIQTKPYPTEAEAVQAWNRAMGERTAKVETVEKPNVYKCGECGQYFHSTAWGSPVTYCSRCGAKLDWDEDIPMEYFESGGI